MTNGIKSGGTLWYEILTSDEKSCHHCKANLAYVCVGVDAAPIPIRASVRILKDLENDIAKYKWENGLV